MLLPLLFQAFFFFSSLGGRGNCKSVQFSVQLPWIPEVECMCGDRHTGVTGERRVKETCPCIQS